MRDKLRALIDQLRLHGMAEVLDAELARAEPEAIPAAEVLVRLLGQEAAARRERSLAYRLAQARGLPQWPSRPLLQRASPARRALRLARRPHDHQADGPTQPHAAFVD